MCGSSARWSTRQWRSRPRSRIEEFSSRDHLLASAGAAAAARAAAAALAARARVAFGLAAGIAGKGVRLGAGAGARRCGRRAFAAVAARFLARPGAARAGGLGAIL